MGTIITDLFGEPPRSIRHHLPEIVLPGDGSIRLGHWVYLKDDGLLTMDFTQSRYGAIGIASANLSTGVGPNDFRGDDVQEIFNLIRVVCPFNMAKNEQFWEPVVECRICDTPFHRYLKKCPKCGWEVPK